MRLGRKRKSPTKRAQIPKRIRRTDEKSAADALLLLSNTRTVKTHDGCVVESSNEDGSAKAIGSDSSQHEKEALSSTTDDIHTTVNNETQVNIFLLYAQTLVTYFIVYAFLVFNRLPLRQVT